MSIDLRKYHFLDNLNVFHSESYFVVNDLSLGTYIHCKLYTSLNFHLQQWHSHQQYQFGIIRLYRVRTKEQNVKIDKISDNTRIFTVKYHTYTVFCGFEYNIIHIFIMYLTRPKQINNIGKRKRLITGFIYTRYRLLRRYTRGQDVPHPSQTKKKKNTSFFVVIGFIVQQTKTVIKSKDRPKKKRFLNRPPFVF